MKFQMPVQHIPRVRIIKSPRFNYSEIEAYPYDWYEDNLMDVRDEIDADQRETCVKLIRYLLENQVDGCIDWGHIDFQ